MRRHLSHEQSLRASFLVPLYYLILEPQKLEAISELSQAQYYFELAVNGQDSDSLFRRALNGGEGKYGFLDIVKVSTCISGNLFNK